MEIIDPRLEGIKLFPPELQERLRGVSDELHTADKMIVVYLLGWNFAPGHVGAYGSFPEAIEAVKGAVQCSPDCEDCRETRWYLESERALNERLKAESELVENPASVKAG